jgi:ferritin
MVNEKIKEAINEQINKEFFSAYLYLSMGMYFESNNLKGVAGWLFIQYKEELTHAEKFIGYLNEIGGRVILKKIDEPKKEWKSILQAFEDAYKHEQFISQSIDKIVDMAFKEKDFATHNFLQWFIKEQVEEEAQTYEIVQKIKLIGTEKMSLYMLNKELGERKLK